MHWVAECGGRAELQTKVVRLVAEPLPCMVASRVPCTTLPSRLQGRGRCGGKAVAIFLTREDLGGINEDGMGYGDAWKNCPKVPEAAGNEDMR
jgi:hypothetical protein